MLIYLFWIFLSDLKVIFYKQITIYIYMIIKNM